MPNKRAPSPDGRSLLEFEDVGEIRFGPPYFALTVCGRAIPSRIFGDAVLWSDDSGLVAVQEWLSLDYTAGPTTKLVLFDVASLSEAGIVRVDGGFISAVSIRDGKVVSTATYFGAGRIATFEHEVPESSAWTKLFDG